MPNLFVNKGMKPRRRNSSVGEDPLPPPPPRLPLVPRGENQEKLSRFIREKVPYIVVTGPAGTGKTFVSARCGLDMTLEGAFERVIVARPIVDVKGASIGYLQGSLDKKLQPYLYPVIQVLQDTLGKAAYQKMLHTGAIEYVHVGHMRGRTFARSFVLIEEAQNASSDTLLMIMSRLGEGSTMVICGDLQQPDLSSSHGLADLVDRVSRTALPSFQGISMGVGDVQRSQALRDLQQLYHGAARES